MSTPITTGSCLRPTHLDGFEVYVDDTGSGDVTVFVHSSGMSGSQWRRSVELLVRSGGRAIVPDLLGAGRSTPWPDGKPFHFSHDVEVVGRLLQDLESPAHLVGHSYGGQVALRVAALAPTRVRSLALYDPVAFGVLEATRDADALADVSRLGFHWGTTAAEHEAWLASFVDYWGGAGSWLRLRDSARAEMIRVGWIAHEGARTVVADDTRADTYRTFPVRTLLLTGETTPLAAQRIVERLGETIPNARVERLAGVGHMGPLTHTDRFNEIVRAHQGA